MSTNPLNVFIGGIGFFGGGLSGWEALRARLGGSAPDREPAPNRPAPQILAPTERRRAPDSVLLALEVASQACAMAGVDPKELPSVFVSSQGDLAINDYMCATLASEPKQLSPTRFHNSVHNAAAGYWTIATGCMQSSSALCGGQFSFGLGLLEASVQAICEARPVLLVAYDVAPHGPLGDVSLSHGPLAVALVLAPGPTGSGWPALRLTVRNTADGTLPPNNPVLQAMYTLNPIAQCLSVLQALDGDGAVPVLTAGPQMSLHVETSAWPK
jgi:Beta-ketoacyl synthase, N-terminal domain